VAPSRFRTVSLIVFLFLAASSLRPWKDLDDKIATAFEPARRLSNLTLPLAWLARGEVRAAEASLLPGEEARRAAGRAVLVSAQTRAAPRDDALAKGRGLVHAEVIDHSRDEPDHLLIRYPPGARVEPGMPVVSGDFYVGRVASVARGAKGAADPGEAAVDLVTGREFRVGAGVEPEALLVVGGVVPRGRRGQPGSLDVLLAVHCPSDAQVVSGVVRVRETDAAESCAGLADGFLLGTLEVVERGDSRVAAVRPGLDYSGGLYQMAIVCPGGPTSAGPELARDPFDEAAWTDVALALPGDPTFWREARIVLAGRDAGLEDGAALALGATFLGSVTRAGADSSAASLLGDAGLEIPALASPLDAQGEPAGAPIAIGRLLSLGRDRSTGEVFLRWDAALPLPAGENVQEGVPAVLYTAAGQRAVPPGLRIGWTVLPRGRGPFALRVKQEVDGLGLVSLRAWRDPGSRP
jgi:hypothetical protein